MTESKLLERLSLLEGALAKKQYSEFCEHKIQSSEREEDKNLWSFLKVIIVSYFISFSLHGHAKHYFYVEGFTLLYFTNFILYELLLLSRSLIDLFKGTVCRYESWNNNKTEGVAMWFYIKEDSQDKLEDCWIRK